MSTRKTFSEWELAALAKKFRLKAGKSKAQVAREMGVTRATMQQAEENATISLSKLRRRIIEATSPYQVVGPGYWLERK